MPAGWFEHTDRLKLEFGGDDLPEIIYIDHYGNAHTGMRASGTARKASFLVGARRLPYARVFSEVAEGETFWYENSQGLAEIAVNCGSAARLLGLNIGDGVAWT
ncbi:MAG: SAM hydroxide adenosyltransferase [Burkholderiales bacterium]